MTYKLALTLAALLVLTANGYVLKDKACAPVSDVSDSTGDPLLLTSTTTEGAVTKIDGSSTTTGPEPYKPCSGRLVIVLDTSKALSDQEFTNQRQFIGHLLFSTNFNYFERLSVSQYSSFVTQIEEFGYFQNPMDVQEYVDAVQRSDYKNANLRRALSAIATAQSADKTRQPTTVAILVSSLNAGEVSTCRELVLQLQDQGVRVILVAHGSKIDSSLLVQVTGDSQLVFEWGSDELEPKDHQKWLGDLLGCPAQTIKVE